MTTLHTTPTTSYLVEAGQLWPASTYPYNNSRTIRHIWRDDIGDNDATIARTLMTLASLQSTDPEGNWTATFLLFDEVTRTNIEDVTPAQLLTLLTGTQEAEQEVEQAVAA